MLICYHYDDVVSLPFETRSLFWYFLGFNYDAILIKKLIIHLSNFEKRKRVELTFDVICLSSWNGLALNWN